MEGKVHENATWKANAEVQGQRPKRTRHRRPKPKAKKNTVRDAKTRGRREGGKEGREQWRKRTLKGTPKPRPKRT